jgi:anti-sigma factor RsiW
MTGLDCHGVRLELTELLLLGRPLPTRLSSHVSTCAACAREVCEIGDVKRTLQLAGPVSLDGAEIASGQEQVGPRRELDVQIARQVRSARVVRWRRIAAGAAAAVLVGCGGLIPVLSHQYSATQPGQSAVRAVELARAGVMIPQPWGTEVPVALSGLQPGQV